ncbi:hypothetical protein [Micromonospora sp. NPDC047134]|uniref:hypothetical protein n=1 Tax=Micromonospora sp. NPDC047134 TaxID=3154340 RepID=UPI0033CE91DE
MRGLPVDGQVENPRLPSTLGASVYLIAVECHGTGLTLRQVDDPFAQEAILGSYAHKSLNRRDVRPPVAG